MPIFDIIADIENLAQNIDHPNNKTIFRGTATTMTSNHIKKIDSLHTNDEIQIQKAYKETRQFFKNNQDLVTVEADKSNTTVLMEKSEYIQKMENILNNNSKYSRLTDDPTLNLQQKNNEIVQQLFNKNHIDKNKKKRLKIYNAQAPRPYAVTKLHKTGHPFRIIIAGINGPSYYLSGYVNDICQQVAQTHRYNIKNSFELKRKLNNVQLNDDEVMASLDVEAMYNVYH